MTLPIDFPQEQTAALAAEARAHGLSAEQYARQVLERTSCRSGFRSRGELQRNPASYPSGDEIDAEIAAARKARWGPGLQRGS